MGAAPTHSLWVDYSDIAIAIFIALSEGFLCCPTARRRNHLPGHRRASGALINHCVTVITISITGALSVSVSITEIQRVVVVVAVTIAGAGPILILIDWVEQRIIVITIAFVFAIAVAIIVDIQSGIVCWLRG